MSAQDDPRTARLLVGGAAAALGLAIFLGTLTQLGSHFLGIEYVDHYGTQWFYWFAEHQLRVGQGPGYTDLFFYPYGKDIFLHTGANVLDAYAAMPFRMLFGDVLGYNLFVLTLLAASGLAMARLAREFTEDRVAAGIAAVLGAVCPYVLVELAEGRPTQAFLLFPALFLRSLWRSGTRPGWRDPALAGLWLALAGYQYWFYAFFGGMVALAHGLWRLAVPGEAPAAPGDTRLRGLGRHALIAGVALALTAPVGVPLALASAGGEVPGLVDVASWSWGQVSPKTAEGESVGLFLWQPLRGATGFYAITDTGGEQFIEQSALTPTALILLLALAMLNPGRLRRGPFLAMFGMAWLLALGPILIVGEGYLTNPLYIALAKALPFLQRLWWPARAYAYMSLLYVIAAAVTLGWVGARSRALQVGLGALVLLGQGWHLRREGLIPFPTWDASVPAGYRCLASGEPGAVVELPFSWTQAHLYYQTVHGRPILGGMIENNPLFAPDEAVKLREDNAWLSTVLELAKVEGEVKTTWTEADKAAVGALGYRYVVLQRDAYYIPSTMPGLVDNAVKTRMRRMRRALTEALGEPVYEDARVNIYAPWGGESPCDRDSVSPDSEARGRTDQTPGLRPTRDPEQVNIRSLLGRKSASKEAADKTDDGDAPAEADAPAEGRSTPAEGRDNAGP